MNLESEIGRQILVPNFVVRWKIEIAGRLARTRRWVDVDLSLDPDRLWLTSARKRQVELARDGIVLDQRLADSRASLRPVQDRKSTRLTSRNRCASGMPSVAGNKQTVGQ